MSNTSPPKPWQVSTTNKATSLNPTNSSQALSTISSTSNGRLKPWEREASVTQGTKAAQVSDISSLQQTSSSMSSMSSAAANDDMGPSSRYGPNRNVGYGSGANDMYGNDRYGSSSSYGGYGGVGGVGGVGGYGSSSYGSGYGSSYGGYGSGYGSSYGGYGSGYGGGYGSSFGSGGYGGGYGGYGSSYGSGYGSSYGGYGSSYGGYGSSYGGYGSSYGSGYGGGYYGGGGGLFGGAGGNPQWAKYGPPAAGYLDWRGAADQGFRWVDGFHHVTAGFGRFVGLLDANSQAMHGALSSIVRLIENAGLLYREIGLAISGFTLFRLIQRIFQRILGSKSSKLNAHPSDAVVNEFQKELPSSLSSSSSSSSTNNSSSSIKFWATFFASIVAVTFFGLPLLHRLINKYSSKNKTIDDIQELESMAASGEAGNAASAHRLRAIHDYPSQAEHELTLRQGDVIRVLQKPFELWWEGEIEGQPGRRGLFPSNYTQPI